MLGTKANAMARVPAPAIACSSHVARGSGGGWLTSAQGQGSGRRGPAGAPLLAQAALQLPELLLLLQHGVLALPPGLPAEVLLQAQAPGRLSDLQLQGQLPLQAAQGVLGRRERQGAHSGTQRTALTPWALDPDPKPRKQGRRELRLRPRGGGWGSGRWPRADLSP